jgi:hypothetical protein
VKGGGAVAKLKPQDSQNWPDLAVPHTGQCWSGPAACEPLPEEELAAGPAGEEGGDDAGGGDAEAGLRMRMPHTSQKSSLAESCPLGQTAMPASSRVAAATSAL